MATRGLNYDDFGVLSDMNNDTLTMANADPSVVTPNLSTIERTPTQPPIQQDAVKTAAPVPADKYYGGAGPDRKAFDEMKGNEYTKSGWGVKGQALADKAAEIRKNPATPMSAGQVRTPEQMNEPSYVYERDHPDEMALGSKILDRQARDAQEGLSNALARATTGLDSLDIQHEMGYDSYEATKLLADRDNRIAKENFVAAVDKGKGLDLTSAIEGAAIDEHNKEVVKDLKTKQLATKKATVKDSLSPAEDTGMQLTPGVKKIAPRRR